MSLFWEINKAPAPDVKAPAVEAVVVWEEGELAQPLDAPGDQLLGTRKVYARKVHVVDFYRSEP